jgi:hypothetical protein
MSTYDILSTRAEARVRHAVDRVASQFDGTTERLLNAATAEGIGRHAALISRQLLVLVGPDLPPVAGLVAANLVAAIQALAAYGEAKALNTIVQAHSTAPPGERDTSDDEAICDLFERAIAHAARAAPEATRHPRTVPSLGLEPRGE